MALNEADLAEYCRKPGVFAAQIKAWRGACEQANDWARIGIGVSTARLSQATKKEKQRIKEWERALARKDRALGMQVIQEWAFRVEKAQLELQPRMRCPSSTWLMHIPAVGYIVFCEGTITKAERNAIPRVGCQSPNALA